MHGKDGRMFYNSTRIARVAYADSFYDDIYQYPNYGDIEQQEVDLEAEDAISEGEREKFQPEH